MCKRMILLTLGILLVTELSTSLAKSGKNLTQSQPASKFLRLQYHGPDRSFCSSRTCVDFNGDGQRELMFASWKTKNLQMLNASDGSVI